MALALLQAHSNYKAGYIEGYNSADKKYKWFLRYEAAHSPAPKTRFGENMWLDLQKMYRDCNLSRIASAEQDWEWRQQGCEGDFEFVEYKWDADGLVIKSRYQYDEKSHRKLDEYGNPMLTGYQYDENGHMTQPEEGKPVKD